MASLERPPPAVTPSPEPAVPAVPALASNMPAPTDTTLGFRPSSAPPLDASVAQFVPASILARYRQTASMGPQAAVPSTIAPSDSVEASNLVGDGSQPRRHRRATAMGGPESMGGAVVANFDALSVGAAAPSMDAVSGHPAAVVYFSNDTTILSADARAQVEATAKAFMAQGAQGYVRIIGHSSGRMGHMTADRFLVWNLERSQARATAVARLLIKAGVPPDKVLVQAGGDGQSAYQDGDGSRRAEIFFQS
jgi:outer membrane protein OmpA-like peptidoglycan-associated protein